MDDELSHAQLEKLEKNPNYKLSEKQKALLHKYRSEKFKNNPNFAKHSTDIKQANGKDNAKRTD